MNERFQEALGRSYSTNGPSNEKPVQNASTADSTDTNNAIITTVEELEGFTIIKSLIYDIVDVNRVKYRDTKYYLRIYIDNCPSYICLLRLGVNKKSMSIKGQKPIYIDHINDLYKHKDLIRSQTRKLLAT